MECNKDEAVRAMGIAEQKMENGDFEGAKKFALKAQNLFPQLENISQLLTVCDVHYCAKCKPYGSEMDWYGILQVEQSADDSSIKKQYRKLALLLHPDKNKFAGAEAAFKLIGEANRTLSDQMRRSQYDMKCRMSLKTAAKETSHQSNRNSSVNGQNGFRNNYQSGSSKFTASYSYQQAHLTFWTLCSACGTKYQYYKDFVNRLLHCPSCGSSFTARDLGPQGYPWNPFSNQKEVPSQGPCKVSLQRNGGKPSKKKEKIGVQMHQSNEGSTAQQKVDGFSNVRDRKKGAEMPKPKVEKPKGSGTSRNAKKRGGKSVEESDESCETGSGTEVEDVVSQEHCRNNGGLNSKVNGGHPPRRSSRQKQHVCYDEKFIDDDDDDFVSPPSKRSKVTDPPNDNVTKKVNSVGPTDVDTCQKDVKQKANAPPGDSIPKKKSRTGESKRKEEEAIVFENNNKVSQVDSGSESSRVSPSPQVFECPDPEFSDFEKHRAENCFCVNQVWATYDTLDGMPRFYARVKKVFSPGFKLRITWLEPDPDEETEQNWVDQDLPVSCGKYCNGSSEECVDRLMFSHRVDSIKGFGKRFFLVYPQKGETWALFRNWDFKWASDPEKHKPPYQYDFVEVLTDFNEENGIGVACLGKVKGFVSIFQQTGRDGVIKFQVSSCDLYRFSHQVPSFRMTGNEREGVPVGSFELDTASLPTNPDELVDPGDMKLRNNNLDSAEICSSPQNQAKATSDSEGNLTPMKDGKIAIERVDSPYRRSTRGSSRLLKDHVQVDTGKYKNGDDSVKDMHDVGSFIQPKGCSTSGDTVEKINTPNKFLKNTIITKSSSVSTRMSSPHETSKSECYDFKREKSEDKFKVDQIWALYGSDGMPKDYAQVKKIEYTPDFKLHVALLENCTRSKDLNLPLCCGIFKVKSGQTKVVSCNVVSHPLRADPIGKNRYKIYPREGEVWAIYKSLNSAHSDLNKTECIVVEVLEDYESGKKAVVLLHVNGSKSLYRSPRSLMSTAGILEIPETEFARFSHQIPAFQHTGEDTCWRGYWELDASAIPGV